MKDVSVLQRFFAFLIDIFIAGLLFCSLLIVLASKGPLFTIINMVIIHSVFLLYTCIDHIYVPSKTGFTFSRWICGYRISNKISALNPTIFQCAIRLLTLVIIESLFALSLISLVTIFFRKDKAAIHDLTSKTKVVRVNNNGHKNIKKIVSILGLLTLSLFLISPAIATLVDRIFIERSNFFLENRAIADSVITNEHSNESFFTLHNVPILPTTSNNTISVYETTEHLYHASEAYLLKIGEAELTFDIVELIALEKLLKIKSISHLLNFNEVAYNSFTSVKQRYGILHPIDSYAVFCLRLIHAATGRSEHRRLLFSTYNDNCFTKYYVYEKNDQKFFLYIEMYDSQTFYGITVKPKNKIDSSQVNTMNAHNGVIRSVIGYGQFSSAEGYEDANIIAQ
jgi:uncharacterized RDD family membrane protein YckC